MAAALTLVHQVAWLGPSAPTKHQSTISLFSVHINILPALFQDGRHRIAIKKKKKNHLVSLPDFYKISFIEKKWHRLTFIYTCWMFVETKRWMWEQWVGGRCVLPATMTVTTVITLTGTDFYKHSMQAFVHHWQKCIGNCDDYVEREHFVAKDFLNQAVLLCSLYLL